MFFEKDYTYPAFTAAERRAHVLDFELARCSLVGNSFHCGVVAFLVSHLFTEWNLLARPLAPAEAAGSSKPFSLHRGVADEGDGQVCADPDPELALVRYYLSRQSIRTGEVRALSEQAMCKVVVPKAIDPDEWKWRRAIATEWRFKGEHINVSELRAYLLSLRWRLKRSHHLGTRFLHLLDSNVSLRACVKGRSSSARLRKVLCRISALCLAGDVLPVLAFVRSHRNPADKPSRSFPKAIPEVEWTCAVCLSVDAFPKVQCQLCRQFCHRQTCAVSHGTKVWWCLSCAEVSSSSTAYPVAESSSGTARQRCRGS